MTLGEQLISFMSKFPDLRKPSWDGWRQRVFSKITSDHKEVWMVLGRGAGKTRIAGLIATFMATQREWPRVPGEQIYCAIISPTRRQSRVSSQYIRGFLHSDPALEAMIHHEDVESISLVNGVVIEVITANIAAPRGRSYACCIIEEAAFLPTDTSNNPDVEILRAVRPGLARVPGSMLVCIGSPYARRGVLWEAECSFGASGGDEQHFYLRAPTLELNPTFDKAEIDRAQAKDPESALSEYFSEFRNDISGYVPIEVVAACVVPKQYELPPVSWVRYDSFFDPSGGSHDSLTLAIAHQDGETRVLDLLREWKAPCSPEAVIAETAVILRSYGLTYTNGDRYGSQFTVDAFARHGIKYLHSKWTRSELYIEGLPLLRSGRARLLDNDVLFRQLTALERSVSRGTGREVVDHPPSGKDDVCNAAIGALVHIETADQPGRGITQWVNGEPAFGWVGSLKWKDGMPWEGICPPDFDEKGRALNQAVRYHKGEIVEILKDWKPAVKRPGTFTRPTWG